jgi:hypothetical protein
MDAQSSLDVITISAAVVTLVQLAKWAGLSDHWGPVAVMFFSMLGVGLWGYSHNQPFAGTMVWEYFTGWINTALAAAGIFGFTRATASSVSKFSPPPNTGAGSNPTDKP